VTVPVHITNNGVAPEDFFFDPRLDTTQSIQLTDLNGTDTFALPLKGAGPEWFVPSQTSSISVAQTSSLPTMFDVSPAAGDPDIASASSGPGPLCATTESASDAPGAGGVTPGIWSAAPTECGPYAAPAPAGTATTTMTAVTQAFDPTITSGTSDLWLEAINPSLPFNEAVVLGPGKSTTTDVTITPAGASGTAVQGMLYVDDSTPGVPPYGQYAGNEVAGLPYSYTIK
jgi:hypothetical protein